LLDRTFTILALFTRARPDWTVTEVATVTGLPIPTVHRILTSLAHHRYVVQDPMTKRYRLHIAALELGRNALAFSDLATIALPQLRSVAEATGETTLLTVPSPTRDASICLHRVESRQELRLSVEPGRRLPLHAGASQKVLLAFMPEDTVESVLAKPLPRLCMATIVDPEALREELARIRARGWATSFQETNVGVWGIAVPILDAGGSLHGSIGIAGPEVRSPRHRLEGLVRRLDLAATTIGSAVGLQSSSSVAGSS
jgi:DNA-binding IclR family transcriptional regulator